MTIDEKIPLLRMIYSDVKKVSDTLASGIDSEGNQVLVNCNGYEVANGKDYNIIGKYIVSENYGILKVVDIENDNEARFDMNVLLKRSVRYTILRTSKSLCIDDVFLILDVETSSYNSNLFILDNKLNLKIALTGLSNSRFSYRNGPIIVFSVSYNYTKYSKLVLNTSTQNIESLDLIDTDMPYVKYIGTEVAEKKFALSKETVDTLRYKLQVNGAIVTSKAYDEIRQNAQLKRDNLYMTYMADEENVLCGIIDITGKELIPNKYFDITHIGSKVFICKNKSQNNDFKYYLINENNNELIDNSYIRRIDVHDTLPLSIIWLSNNEVRLIDSKDNIFSITDFAKYFSCSYCETRPDILRVEIIDGMYKYISNRLASITNIQMVKTLRNEKWVPM